MKVANGALLKVVAIWDLTLTDLQGFKLNTDATATPTTTSATWHDMLIVEGLDPHTVLLSVKKMREDDGINTYFNSDNAAAICDCLKLPNGVYVPFTSDSFELYGRPSTDYCQNIQHKQSSRSALHAALCHAGRDRVRNSRITIDGEPVTRLPPTEICKGCALGGTRREHREGVSARRRTPKTDSSNVTFFGQCIYSDTCMGFEKSFPHGFTGMVNFCGAYTGDRDFYFLCRPHDPGEVGSAVRKYHASVRPHLKDDKILGWQTDNGGEFRGDMVDGVGGLVEDLIREKRFSVPNVKNSNPIPERAWGVIQRALITPMPMPRLASGRGPFIKASSSTTTLLLLSTRLPGRHMNCFTPILGQQKLGGHEPCSVMCWLLFPKEMYMAKQAISLRLGVTLGMINGDEDIMYTARGSNASAPTKYCNGMRIGSSSVRPSLQTHQSNTILLTTYSLAAKQELYYPNSYGAHQERRTYEQWWTKSRTAT